MKIHTLSNQTDFQNTTIAAIAAILKKSPKRQLHVALSGGSETPQLIYQPLSKDKNILWEKISLYLVDERYVPLNHLQSNYRKIHENLIKNLAAVRQNFHYFDTSLTITAALKKYQATLPQISGGRFDLAILGLGPDGHTASLFPLGPALRARRTFTAHTTTTNFVVPDRLTLTFPAIMSSRQIFLILKGTHKTAILHDLLHGRKSITQLPAKKLLQHPSLHIYFGNY